MDSDKAPLIQTEKDDERRNSIKRNKIRYVAEVVIFLSTLTGYPRKMLDVLLITHLIEKESPNPNNITPGYNESHGNCSEFVLSGQSNAQEKAAVFVMYQTLVKFVPTFIACVFLGAYSDRVGRKYALVPPELGSAITSLIYMIVISFDLSVYYILIGDLVESFAGEWHLMQNVTYAYMADTTESRKLTFRMGLLQVVNLVSSVLGYLGAGVWTQNMGFLYPYLFVFCGKIVVVLIIMFILPETVQKDSSAKFFSTGHLRAIMKTFYDPNNSCRNRILALLLVSVLSSQVAFNSNIVDTLFLTNTPLCFPASLVGYYLATFNGVVAVGCVITNRILSLCLPDHWIAVIAGVFSFGSTFYKAFVTTFLMIWFVPILAFPVGNLIPSIGSIMSKTVEAKQQGCVFGAVAAMDVIASLIGRLTMNAIFASTAHFMNGFSFICASAFYVVTVIVLLLYIRERRKTREHCNP